MYFEQRQFLCKQNKKLKLLLKKPTVHALDGFGPKSVFGTFNALRILNVFMRGMGNNLSFEIELFYEAYQGCLVQSL